MEFKDIIKSIRFKMSMSQEDFAKFLGVSFATVNRWENGKHLPTFKTKRKILKICKDFCCDFEYKNNYYSEMRSN